MYINASHSCTLILNKGTDGIFAYKPQLYINIRTTITPNRTSAPFFAQDLFFFSTLFFCPCIKFSPQNNVCVRCVPPQSSVFGVFFSYYYYAHRQQSRNPFTPQNMTPNHYFGERNNATGEKIKKKKISERIGTSELCQDFDAPPIYRILRPLGPGCV